MKTDIVDPDNYMNFDYFIKVYEAALAWNKALFEEQKQEFVNKRRALIKCFEENEGKASAEYRQICTAMQQKDEECLQEVIDSILGRIKMSDSDFQRSILHHSSDPAKLMKI